MISITLTGDGEREVVVAAKGVADRLVSEVGGERLSGMPFVIYGPFPAGVYKLNEKYRMRIAVKCRQNRTVRAVLSELLSEFSGKLRGVTVSIDINPLGT